MDLSGAALERAGAAILACDLEGNVILRNAAARKMFGEGTLSCEHPLWRALHGEPSRGVRIASGTSAGTVLVDAEPLFDGNHKRIGAVATCWSLKQPVGSDEARKRLELLLESTGEGIYGIDLEGKCTFVNGSAAAMVGYMREDLCGKNIHQLIHHTHTDGRPYRVEDCPIYGAFRLGRGCRVDDENFYRSDGSFFPVEYSSYPILDEGVLQGAVVTFSDISARKRAEAALRASEAKYRSLFESVTEGVYQTSPDGELLAANRALIEMLGYASEHELRAQDVATLYVNPGDRRRFAAQLERDGRLVDVELHLKRKDGKVITVIENARAVRDDRKRLVYYEGTLRFAGGKRE